MSILIRFLASSFCSTLVSSTLAATPYCRPDTNAHKYFRLELTVPASFCQEHSKNIRCNSSIKPPSLQLHGLWPNYKYGWPQGVCPDGACRKNFAQTGRFCNYPKPPGLYDSKNWQTLKVYMAGTNDCLERHEWIKHGTCSLMNAADYFSWSLKETRLIDQALALIPSEILSRETLDQRIKNAIPKLNGAMRFKCKKESLAAVSIFYEWGLTPGTTIKTKSKTNSYGNCPHHFTIPNFF